MIQLILLQLYRLVTYVTSFYPKKAMLSIWWDCRGPIYYELLPMNMYQTSSGEVLFTTRNFEGSN